MRNNIFSTLHCALAAEAVGVRRFILVSTDKAVRPTNIMGASKRVRSEEHTSELQSLMRISYAVFCLKKKNNNPTPDITLLHAKRHNKTSNVPNPHRQHTRSHIHPYS